MVEHVPGQLAIDIDDLIRQAELENAGEWHGAPLGYTADYYTPGEHQAAMDRWILEHGHFACRLSGIWSPTLTNSAITADDHNIVILSAHAPEETIAYQANCGPCRWHYINTENAVIEAAHDHAMPGWRDLPILPTKHGAALSTPSKQTTQRVTEWIHEHYPTEWIFPGAPVRTTRQRYGTRHVSGRSPLGGYDLSAGIRDDG